MAARRYTYRRRRAPTRRRYMRGRGAYMYPTYLKGRGDYRTTARKIANYVRGATKGMAPRIGSALGGFAGKALGARFGAPSIGANIGASIGSMAGRGFQRLTGFGDYNIKGNSLMTSGGIVPSFGDGTLRVRKREYIASLNGTTAFSNAVFPIQPGLVSSFPWLSRIANQFEQYRFNGLVYQFVSTSSVAIASTTDLGLGQICMATDYNAADPAFVDISQALGSMFSNSGRPSNNLLHAIECAPQDQQQRLYYVRAGDVTDDIRLYDMGKFQFMTFENPGDFTGMGQLWVSYDITLMKPHQNNQLGFALQTDHWTLSGVDNTHPIGSAANVKDVHSQLGTTINSAGTLLSFPSFLESGYFLINHHIVGGSVALADYTTTLTNCEALKVWDDDAVADVSNSGSTSTRFLHLFLIRITKKGATISFSSGTFPSSPTGADLVITQVNGEIYLENIP